MSFCAPNTVNNLSSGAHVVIPLGDIIDIRYGKDHQHIPSGDVPVHGTGGVMRHGAEALGHGPAILIGRKGTIDKPRLVHGPYWAVDTVFHCPVSPEFDPDFIFALVAKVNWKRLSEATGVPSLSASSVANVKLTVPVDRAEQERLSGYIKATDQKIDALKAKKSAVEDYKRGLMQKLFSREIRFAREDGATFPMWKEVRLGDVFHERVGKGPDGGELLSVTMKKGVMKAADVGRADGASADLSSYKHVLPGDIAYNSMRMWQGASGLSKHSGIVSPAYTVVTPEDDQCGVFWSYYLKLPELVFQFRRHSQGLTSDTWNLKFPAFSRIKVVVPDIAEQKLIGSALMGIDQKIEKLDAHIESMGAFKKGLLQKLFV